MFFPMKAEVTLKKANFGQEFIFCTERKASFLRLKMSKNLAFFLMQPLSDVFLPILHVPYV